MYILLAIIFLKAFNPFFKKYSLKSLSSHDYLYLNAFLIMVLVIFYFIFNSIRNPSHSLDFLKKFKNIKLSECVILVVMAISAIGYTIYMFETTNANITSTSHAVITDISNTIFVILIGLFIFGEKHTLKQMVGIFLCLVGFYFMLSK
jgi:drug/metabolite transporter (DMT)-like permease